MFTTLFRLFQGQKAFDSMPGPPPFPLLGNVLDFIGKTDRPWEVFAEYGRKHGGMCVFWTFGEPAVVLNDAALIEELLVTRREHFYKDSPCPELVPVLTMSSPNINNGEAWTKLHDIAPLVQPYAREWMERQRTPVLEHVRARARELAAVAVDKPFMVLPETEKLMFDCFSLGAIGRVLPQSAYDDFMRVATYGSDRMKASGTPSAELPPDGRDARERWIDEFSFAIKNDRAKPRANAWDLLATVLRHGTTLDDRDLAAELGNIFYGGDFSGPSTLVSALWLLTQHPAEAAKLRAALGALDGSVASLMACTALDQVLREAMRLLPAVTLWGRRVLPDAPTTLGGRELPAHTKIYLTSWRLHRDATVYPDPDAFRPERWTPELVAKSPYAGSGYFFPLGMGPRTCLGGHYVVFLLKLMLSELAGPFEVTCGKDQPYDAGQTFFFGTRMPAGLKATVRSTP